MINDIIKLSGATLLGILIGVLVVSYIRPTETGGAAILIAVPTITCTILGRIFVAIRRKREVAISGKKDEAEAGGNSP